MKKLFSVFTLMMSAVIYFGGSSPLQAQSGAAPESPKILIAYFSHSGNTRVIAQQIQDKVGGDLFEIKAAAEYSPDYNTVVEQAKVEKNANSRPPLASSLDNAGSYDVIFLGYPNWWATMPMPLFTFLEAYDFSGKTIIPFCTHEGSRLGSSVNDLKRLAPNSTVLDGLAVRGGSVNSAQNDVGNWLKKISF